MLDRWRLGRRLRRLHDLVGSPELDLPLPAWHDLYEIVASFDPDLIVELGRGYGNSTCVFTEAAGRMRALVVSIGNDGGREWETGTARRLGPCVGHGWFRPLTVVHDDNCGFNYEAIVSGQWRVFVYWDAHGVDVAATVLAGLLPLLPPDNLVVVDEVWVKDGPHLLPPQPYAGPFASLFASSILDGRPLTGVSASIHRSGWADRRGGVGRGEVGLRARLRVGGV